MSDVTPSLSFIDVPGAASRTGAQRRMAYWDWAAQPGGNPNHVVVCVHGLTRQGRDFDVLAQALTPHCRVVSVDVAGRGHSDWLADPLHYQVPTYAGDMIVLLQHLRQQNPAVQIDWVGTSMGGLIGMGVTSLADHAPRRLVLNDVGPALEWSALQRIGTYVGADPSFASVQSAVDAMAILSVGFGPHTPEQWRALSLPMLRERDGRWHLHYDPAIGQPFKALLTLPDEQAQQAAAAGEAALWAAYDAIAAPTLVLRGAHSDLLSEATLRAMTERGPRASAHTVAGVGHAPTLVAADQVAVVKAFLLG